MNRTLCLALLVAASSPSIGCGKLAKVALKGTLENVGAEMVDGSSEQDLREMIAQADAGCPIKMDAYTTLESVKMIDENHAEFRYRVSNEGKALARRFDKDVLRDAAIKMMKGNAMAVAIAERDLSIEHIYEDPFGGHVLSYTINKQVLEGNFHPMGHEQTNPFNVTTVKADSSTDVTVKPAMASAENETLADQDESPKVTPAVAEVVEPPAPPKPMLPKAFKPTRSIDNPAGIQANPFIE